MLSINNDLHLLLSESTVATAAPDIGDFWARFMTAGTNGNPLTVEVAWYTAGERAYIPETNQITINFRVAGWPDAFPEHITDVANTPGTGNPADITFTDRKVFPLP